MFHATPILLASQAAVTVFGVFAQLEAAGDPAGYISLASPAASVVILGYLARSFIAGKVVVRDVADQLEQAAEERKQMVDTMRRVEQALARLERRPR